MIPPESLLHYFERQYPLNSLTCPPLRERFGAQYQELLALFAKYHIHSTEHETETHLTFPEGTYKKLLYPIVTTERYQIFVPGGFFFYQTYTPAHTVVVLIPIQFFSPETQELYTERHPPH